MFLSRTHLLIYLLKLKTAGESGQEGKEDMTVIQEMITTLQVLGRNIILASIHHPTNSSFPAVCEGGRPGDGEEGVHDPVDQDGQVFLAGITKLQKGDRTKNINFTLALQEWNHGWFNRAFPYGAPSLT